jgi:hypothetical protein
VYTVFQEGAVIVHPDYKAGGMYFSCTRWRSTHSTVVFPAIAGMPAVVATPVVGSIPVLPAVAGVSIVDGVPRVAGVLDVGGMHFGVPAVAGV